MVRKRTKSLYISCRTFTPLFDTLIVSHRKLQLCRDEDYCFLVLRYAEASEFEKFESFFALISLGEILFFLKEKKELGRIEWTIVDKIFSTRVKRLSYAYGNCFPPVRGTMSCFRGFSSFLPFPSYVLNPPLFFVIRALTF